MQMSAEFWQRFNALEDEELQRALVIDALLHAESTQINTVGSPIGDYTASSLLELIELLLPIQSRIDKSQSVE